MHRYDLIVIGGGTAGLVTAAGAAGFGARTALIERDRLGGECLWSGCVPTKALVRAARVAATVRGAGSYGVRTGPVTVDYAGVMDHVRRAMAAVARHDSPERFQRLGVDVITGEARFLDGHQVVVGERERSAKRFVIASGSRSVAPPIPGLQEAGYWTHVEALQQTELPDAIAILGAGPIGLEFAQVYARLGARVTVFELADRILVREDAEVAALAHAGLVAEGITIHTGTRVVAVRQESGRKVVVGQTAAGDEVTVSVAAILVAAGRAPNLEALHLDAAGVAADRRGITVDATLRTTARHIWAAGDAVGHSLFTHIANYQGRLVVGNALFPLCRRVDYRVLPWVTFTDPEVAHLGQTEDEARQDADAVRVYRYGFGDLDRVIADGEARGLIKVICDRRGRILGAHIIGPGAGELIHELALARRRGVTIGELSQLIHAYPTLSEGVQRAADQYWRERLFSGALPRILKGLRAVFG